jgi:hypothetical protein
MDEPLEKSFIQEMRSATKATKPRLASFGDLLENAPIIVGCATIFGAIKKEGFARTVRVRAHDLGANDLGEATAKR